MLNKIVIFGMGDLAKQLHYYIDNYSNNQVIGFTVNQRFITDKHFNNLPVLPFETLDQYINRADVEILLCIGYNDMNMRAQLFNEIVIQGWNLTNFIHPNAKLAKNVRLGLNNIVLDSAIIEPFTSIGDNNIIWSNAIICHDNYIGSHNFIAANSVSGGFNKLENKIFLGFSSVFVEKISVVSNVTIGANSLVLKDIIDVGTYVGSPAKRIR